MKKLKTNKEIYDFEIQFEDENRMRVLSSFDRWCVNTNQPFPRPAYSVLIDYRVSSGKLRGVFLDEIKGRKFIKFAKKLLGEKK